MCPARIEFPNHQERPPTFIASGRLFTEITTKQRFVAIGTDTGFSWISTDTKNNWLDGGIVVAPNTKVTPDGAVLTAVLATK